MGSARSRGARAAARPPSRGPARGPPPGRPPPRARRCSAGTSTRPARSPSRTTGTSGSPRHAPDGDARLGEAVDQPVHVARAALAAPLAELIDAADACAAAGIAGLLDRGAVAEIIGAANIEVNAVRVTNAADPTAGLPAPDALDAWLRTSWERHLRALEIDPAAVDSRTARSGLLGFHLHNYAAFLAGHPGEDDLLASVRLFRDCVLPARSLFHERSGVFDPLRHSLQVASRATSTLAEEAVAKGAFARARTWAGQGLAWIRRALDHPSSEALLAEATEPACRMALLAARALLVGHEAGAAESVATDLSWTRHLLAVARLWEHNAVGDDPDAHARHGEIVDLEMRLEKCRSTP